MKVRSVFFAAGVLGASGVALGAFGAHALRSTLTALATRDRWETAVFYHLVHALALLAVATWFRLSSHPGIARRLAWAVRCWIGGILLFSGALYVLALLPDAPLWFKIAVPPLGGSAFIVGWLMVASAAFVADS